MDEIETAIRSALEKGDIADRAFREKVYRSAFAALDRALKTNTHVTVETAINRRKRLQAQIAKIESGFISGASKMASGMPVGERMRTQETSETIKIDNSEQPAEAPEVVVERDRTEPVMDMPVDLTPVLDMSAGRHPSQPDPWELGVDIRMERSHFPEREGGYAGQLPSDDAQIPVVAERMVEPGPRGRYSAVFAVITVLSACIIGLWWAYDTDLFKTAAQIDTSVPKPPASTGVEDFDPYDEPIREPAKSGSMDAKRDWIKVFSPGDSTPVGTPTGTEVQPMHDEVGDFIRIRSGISGLPGSSVTFDVGQGILEQLAGNRVIFVIVARAEEGHETQISVDCNFGELGDCGRKRYAVGYQQGEFLFEIELPDKAPGADGSIAINSDIANEGRAVDVFEIKASIAQ